MDTCLILPPDQQPDSQQQGELVVVAKRLLQKVKVSGRGRYTNMLAIDQARIPIVKLEDTVTGIEVDICINNTLAVHNTQLLRAYVYGDDDGGGGG